MASWIKSLDEIATDYFFHIKEVKILTVICPKCSHNGKESTSNGMTIGELCWNRIGLFRDICGGILVRFNKEHS